MLILAYNRKKTWHGRIEQPQRHSCVGGLRQWLMPKTKLLFSADSSLFKPYTLRTVCPFHRCRLTWRTPPNTTSSRPNVSRWRSTCPTRWATTWPARSLGHPPRLSQAPPLSWPRQPIARPAAPWPCSVSAPTRKRWVTWLLHQHQADGVWWGVEGFLKVHHCMCWHAMLPLSVS